MSNSVKLPVNKDKFSLGTYRALFRLSMKAVILVYVLLAKFILISSFYAQNTLICHFKASFLADNNNFIS